METLEAPHIHGNQEDAEYDAYLARIQARFATVSSGPLFETNAVDLWGIYLLSIPEADRQYHNCNACRHFIERFGGLVTISEDGLTTPAIWNEDDAPAHYKDAAAHLAYAVRKAKVTGPFLNSDKNLGTPVTGQWRHLAVKNAQVYRNPLLTACQAMAAKREDFNTVMHALGVFTQAHLSVAVALLESNALYRSEKVLGQAKWLQALQAARTAATGRAKANVVWLATGTAPAGFCHPRSSMIGTLLDDIAAGMGFADVSKRFAEKMNPLQYQRPQAAPAAGNIAQAERDIAKLGLAPSLERRIARLDEIPKLWEPKAPTPAQPAGGVFAHLQAKGSTPVAKMVGIPPVVMTLEKFARVVVPTADTIELQISGSTKSFIALTTAVHLDAPPILQWDYGVARNPFAWYVWNGGSLPSQFGLSHGWVKVSAITRLPARWNDSEATHHGDGILLMLDGARETRHAGNALFPECLKSSLHGIRSTLEAYARHAQMQGLEEGSAIGYDLRDKSGGYPALVRVTSSGQTTDYKIDRWD